MKNLARIGLLLFCLSLPGGPRWEKQSSLQCHTNKKSKKNERQKPASVKSSGSGSRQLEITADNTQAACSKPGSRPKSLMSQAASLPPLPLGASLYSLDWAGGTHSWHGAHISQHGFTESHSKCCILGLRTANIRRETSLEKRNTLYRKKEEKEKSDGLIASRQVRDWIDLHF